MALGFFALAALLKLNMMLPEGAMPTVEVVLRWTHFAAGTIWIGLLYFFNLVQVPTMGELEATTKNSLLTKMMPRALWWFRWASVLTVLAGLLYFVIYLMTDARNAGDPTLAWKWLGLWFVVWVVAWGAMYMVMRPLPNGWLVAGAGVIVIGGASWIVLTLLSHPDVSNRTLSISVGGGMGFFLLLNVWGVIWRAQKRLIAWTAAAAPGTPMPAEAARLMRLAYLASRTSFWISFPMLFFMATASHYPFLSGR
jgi:uncharacterized membrane protein